MVTCVFMLIGDLNVITVVWLLGSLWERCGLALFVFPPTLTFLEVGDFVGPRSIGARGTQVSESSQYCCSGSLVTVTGSPQFSVLGGTLL